RGCLYLHYDGVRYCFKTTPNVNMLIEQEAEAVDRERGAVDRAVRERLDSILSGRRDVIVWPDQSDRIPDGQPVFLVAYLPLDVVHKRKSDQEKLAKEFLEKCGEKPRRYRNALALAIPDRSQITPLQRSVRYLLAIDRVSAKKSQYQLTKAQLDELAERRRTEAGGEQSALRELYKSLWLPKLEDGAIAIDPLDMTNRPLQATEVHARVLELLTGGPIQRVFGTLAPRRIIERMKLGEAPEEKQPPRLGASVGDVVDAFFGILGFPRLTDLSVLAKAISAGVEQGLFVYVGSRSPTLGEDGRYLVAYDRVTFQRPLPADEIDFDEGFLMLPSAMPVAPEGETPVGPAPPVPPGPDPPGPVPPGPGPKEGKQTAIQLSFWATREQLFAAWSGLANLADAAGTVHVTVEARKEDGFDEVWLRNAVTEPVEESGAEVDGR
ncbi:MAG TPA: AAA family ATPase, partial [Anaerolineae bacterium]|nr:AAA family ATPase [Anaerolineae bacterium]